MALHIIAIPMKRIPIAIATDLARTNGDAVKDKKKKKRVRKMRKGSVIFLFNLNIRSVFNRGVRLDIRFL